MKAFIAGTIFGLVLATVGFSGIARILDHGVETVKTQSVEMANYGGNCRNQLVGGSNGHSRQTI